MTRSNRILNRLALVLLALLALTAAAFILRPEVERFVLEPLGLVVPSLGLAELGTVLPLALIVLAVVAVIVALAVTVTRGRGADGTALDQEGVSVDAGLLEGLLRRELDGEDEVLHLRLRAFRARHRVLLAEVQVRRGADLANVHRRVARAVATADEQLGEALPLVTHITTGLRTRFAGTTRTH